MSPSITSLYDRRVIFFHSQIALNETASPRLAEQISKIADTLVQALPSRIRKKTQIGVRVILAWALKAYQVSSKGKPHAVCYRRDPKFFAGGKISFPVFDRALKLLVEAQMLNHFLQSAGYKYVGKQSSLFALSKPFSDRMKYHLKKELVVLESLNVIVKDANKEDITAEYERLPEFITHVAVVKKINEVNLRADIRDQYGAFIDPTCKQIFNHDLNSTGRYYNEVQNMPKDKEKNNGLKERELLKIDGKPVVEIDFSSMHPTILYRLHGLQAPEDCYAIPTEALPEHWDHDKKRRIIKIALNIAINARTHAAAVGGIVNELYEEMSGDNAIQPLENDGQKLTNAQKGSLLKQEHGIDVHQLIRDIKEYHHPIKKHFSTGDGLRLMRIDSEIAKRIILNFVERGIPCIPIHDSFIVQQEYESELQEAMEVHFNDVVNREWARNILGIGCVAHGIRGGGRAQQSNLLEISSGSLSEHLQQPSYYGDGTMESLSLFPLNVAA